jgi:hypothetical protein
MKLERELSQFRYFSKDPNKIIGEIKGEILFVDVPHYCFFGTQPITEYSQKKETLVKRLLSTNGKDFLTRCPVISTALPVNINSPNDFYDNPHDVYQLVLLDGHHRVRFAPKYGILSIPTTILSLSQTAEAYKIHSISKMNDILNRWTNETLASFSKKMINFNSQRLITFEINSRGILVPKPITF